MRQTLLLLLLATGCCSRQNNSRAAMDLYYWCVMDTLWSPGLTQDERADLVEGCKSLYEIRRVVQN